MFFAHMLFPLLLLLLLFADCNISLSRAGMCRLAHHLHLNAKKREKE